MNRLPAIVRQHIAALRILLTFTVICGLVYPLMMVGIGQVAFRNQANGSLVTYKGKTVGSSLLCQEFVDAKGNPLPQWFQPRPSAATTVPNTNAGQGQLGTKTDWGCDPLASSATNLGPSNQAEVADIRIRQQQYAALNHVPVSQVPPDAVTASASGLDPDISPQNAYDQVDRVAAARGLPVSVVRGLVTKFIQGRTLGFLGEPRVDVLTLNIALASLPGQSGS